MSKNIIYIIGTGQNPKDHLTLEAVRVIKKSDKLLLINGDSESVIQAINGHNNYEDIVDLYVDGDIDDNNYNRIVKKIVTDSEKNKIISVTTAGHPLIGVSWWERLKKSKSLDSEIIYIEGISSWTGVFTEFEHDPLENGVLTVDANRLLMFDQTINPEFDTLIFNFCSTGTRKTNISAPYVDNEILFLKKHLLQFYPKNHLVSMISARHFDEKKGNIINVELMNLEDILPKISFYSSLFIKGVNPKSYNKDFLKKLIGIE